MDGAARGPIGAEEHHDMNKLIGLLALYAAGAATYLYVTRQDAAPAPATVVADTPEYRDARAIKTEAREFVRDELGSFVREIEQRIQTLKSIQEDLGTELTRAKDVAEGAGRQGVEKLQDIEARLTALKQQDDLPMRLDALEKSLPGLKKRILELEKRPAVREVITQRPEASGPKEPARPTLPEDTGPSAAEIRAAVATAMAQLASNKLEVMVLGIEGVRKHKVREAIPRLLDILKESKEEFARQAVAAALGDLKDCDAVFALADAFVDSSPMVAQQAHRAVRKITGFDSGISPSARIRERRKAKGAIIQWWRTNEARVRAELNQPKKPPAGG